MFLTKFTKKKTVPANRMVMGNKNIFFRRKKDGTIACNAGYMNTGRDPESGRFTSPTVAVLQQR